MKNPYGIYNLGCCYEVGFGVPQNLNEAIRLYKLAAPKVPRAQKALDVLSKNV
jgi:TPR repeat protein